MELFSTPYLHLDLCGQQLRARDESALEVAPPDRRLDRRPTAFTTMRYTNRQPLPFFYLYPSFLKIRLKGVKKNRQKENTHCLAAVCNETRRLFVSLLQIVIKPFRLLLLWSQLHKLTCTEDKIPTVWHNKQRVSRVLHPARHIIGYFGDKSFQAITCTGTDNAKQMGENTPKTQNKQTGPR